MPFEALCAAINQWFDGRNVWLAICVIGCQETKVSEWVGVDMDQGDKKRNQQCSSAPNKLQAT